jgi:hypothetical protein
MERARSILSGVRLGHEFWVKVVDFSEEKSVNFISSVGEKKFTFCRYMPNMYEFKRVKN